MLRIDNSLHVSRDSKAGGRVSLSLSACFVSLFIPHSGGGSCLSTLIARGDGGFYTCPECVVVGGIC